MVACITDLAALLTSGFADAAPSLCLSTNYLSRYTATDFYCPYCGISGRARYRRLLRRQQTKCEKVISTYLKYERTTAGILPANLAALIAEIRVPFHQGVNGLEKFFGGVCFRDVPLHTDAAGFPQKVL